MIKNKLAFTLVELLAVVIILSILTAIAVPQYTKSIKRAEAVNALTSLKTIFDSAKRYRAERGSWPTSMAVLDTKLLLNQGSTDTSDVFQYTLGSNTVTASRVNPDGGAALYTLTASYGSGNKRDIYSCTSAKNTGKYHDLCASLCRSGFQGNKCYLNDSSAVSVTPPTGGGIVHPGGPEVGPRIEDLDPLEPQEADFGYAADVVEGVHTK